MSRPTAGRAGLGRSWVVERLPWSGRLRWLAIGLGMAIALAAPSAGPDIVSASADSSLHAVSPARTDTGVGSELARSGLVENRRGPRPVPGMSWGRQPHGGSRFRHARCQRRMDARVRSRTSDTERRSGHAWRRPIYPRVRIRPSGYDPISDGEVTPSSPVGQPTTAEEGVADLRALLAAAAEPGPYVLVGASWGGLIVKLFASRHPSDVAGLVFATPPRR